MNSSDSVFGLIVGRECRERLRSSGFWISTWLSVLAVIVAVAVPSVHHDSGASPKAALVGTFDPIVTAHLAAVAASFADPGADETQLPVYSDERVARSALHDGTVDILLLGTASIMTRHTLDAGSKDRTTRLALALQEVLATENLLAAVNVSPSAVARATSAQVPVTIESLDGIEGTTTRDARRAVAAVGVGLIVLFVIVYGGWILDGVLEERSSRVVELLIAAVRPRQLLRGKVAGIGVVALLQGLLMALAALAASSLAGADSPLHGEGRLLVGLVFWFFLAYAVYAPAFASVGSITRRHDEAQSASFLVIAPLIAAAAALAPVMLGGRSDGLTTALSIFPMTAPVAMPVRLALGTVPAGQMVVSLALMVVTSVALMTLAGGLYTWSTMRLGARTPLDPRRGR